MHQKTGKKMLFAPFPQLARAVSSLGALNRGISRRSTPSCHPSIQGIDKILRVAWKLYRRSDGARLKATRKPQLLL
jgi:hypothetical protein